MCKEEQQMTKQKKDSQDYCKENKSPKQSQVNVHSRRQRGEYRMRGASVKHSGIVCTWLF